MVGGMTSLCILLYFMEFQAKVIFELATWLPWGGGWKHDFNVDIRIFGVILSANIFFLNWTPPHILMSKG